MNKYYGLLLVIPFFLFNLNLYSQEEDSNKGINVSNTNQIEEKKLVNPVKKRYKTPAKERPKENIPSRENITVNPERKFSTATKIPKTVHRRTTKEDLQKEIRSLQKQIANLEQSTDTNRAAKLEKLYKVLEKRKEDLRLKG